MNAALRDKFTGKGTDQIWEEGHRKMKKENSSPEKDAMNKTDAEKIRALAKLDDDGFEEVLKTVVASLGLSPAQISAVSANGAAIKRLLAGARDADIRRLAGRLDAEKTGELLDKLGK